MSEAWTVGRVVRWAADDFRTRGIQSPRLEAELLLALVLRTDRMRIIVESERPLVADELARYKQSIQRRRKGEPIAYIVGEKEFYGRMFRIDQCRVRIPRRWSKWHSAGPRRAAWAHVTSTSARVRAALPSHSRVSASPATSRQSTSHPRR
jgi:hypothetical protein